MASDTPPKHTKAMRSVDLEFGWSLTYSSAPSFCRFLLLGGDDDGHGQVGEEVLPVLIFHINGVGSRPEIGKAIRPVGRGPNPDVDAAAKIVHSGQFDPNRSLAVP